MSYPMNFSLKAPFVPAGDQPQAIKSLIKGIKSGLKHQVLLGVTGSGKTFTISKVIEELKRPTLIISHNKTLAAQLYQEFRDFFPQNAVSYFVSYYDFYQPEAYIPQTDTYIEKETEINEEIDKLRLLATTNLLTRSDTVIVASVSCIYNLGNPKEYGKFVLELARGVYLSRESIIKRLIDLQYQRSDFASSRSTFRVRGENIDVFLSYEDSALRISSDGKKILKLVKIDPVDGKIIEELNSTVIYPAKHYLTDVTNKEDIFEKIRQDLKKQVAKFSKEGKMFEAHRLNQKVNYDLEMIEEMGYVNGIENYSRYFDLRKEGDPPYSLMDYFRQPYNKDWLLIIDESHITVPQIRGMYLGDRSRKQTLIDFGFRLPSALDNRPLQFSEFMDRMPQTIYVSATPNIWETNLAEANAKKLHLNNYSGITEQIIRPTGITDPVISVRKTKKQVIDLIAEIVTRKKRKERVLVTTLTKRMAEDLAEYFEDQKYLTLAQFQNLSKNEIPLVHYLHSDIETLERSDLLDDLRQGKYDCLIGINLLREGLDLPEVSLVAILDADKEGFLRSETSLIQTMGRAARHIEGSVIMYADRITASMSRAIKEIERRRDKQLDYNRKHKVKIRQIIKPVREKLIAPESRESPKLFDKIMAEKRRLDEYLKIDYDSLTPLDTVKLTKKMESEMKKAAQDLNFELAASLRDKINDIRKIFDRH